MLRLIIIEAKTRESGEMVDTTGLSPVASGMRVRVSPLSQYEYEEGI